MKKTDKWKLSYGNAACIKCKLYFHTVFYNHCPKWDKHIDSYQKAVLSKRQANKKKMQRYRANKKKRLENRAQEILNNI